MVIECWLVTPDRILTQIIDIAVATDGERVLNDRKYKEVDWTERGSGEVTTRSPGRMGAGGSEREERKHTHNRLAKRTMDTGGQ